MKIRLWSRADNHGFNILLESSHLGNYSIIYWPRTYFYLFFRRKREDKVWLFTSCSEDLVLARDDSDIMACSFLLKNK